MSNRPRLSPPAARRHTTNPPASHSRRGRRVAAGAAALLIALTSTAPAVGVVGGIDGVPSSTPPPAGSDQEHPAPLAATPTVAAADLIRARQWPLEALHIPRTWKYTRGAGVTVAVLDTGVDGTHPDLAGSVISGPDFTGHTRRPGSKYWGRHGTAMASIIAGHGHGPDQEAGIMGVAPRAKVLSIRVTLENEDPARRDKAQLNRSRDAVAKGIRYAVDNGALVINMSLGGGTAFYDGSPAEEEAVKYAIRQGAVLVASSGNDGAKLNRRTFPAAYSGVIAVGAVNKRMRPTKFSNHNDYVSVAAPGDDIVMADTGQGYVVGTGTSPSAAYVAGVAALVRARYPQLTPEQVRRAIEAGATHRPPGGRDERVGVGVVDAYRTLMAAREIDRKAYATTAPQDTQAAPLPESRPVRAPNGIVMAVLLVGATVLMCGIIMLFFNLRRRARAEAEAEPLPLDADWAEDDWATGDRERAGTAAGAGARGATEPATAAGAAGGTSPATAADSVSDGDAGTAGRTAGRPITVPPRPRTGPLAPAASDEPASVFAASPAPGGRRAGDDAGPVPLSAPVDVSSLRSEEVRVDTRSDVDDDPMAGGDAHGGSGHVDAHGGNGHVDVLVSGGADRAGERGGIGDGSTDGGGAERTANGHAVDAGGTAADDAAANRVAANGARPDGHAGTPPGPPPPPEPSTPAAPSTPTLPSMSSARRGPRPASFDFDDEPIPKADPDAFDMATPIAEQSWISMRRNRARRRREPTDLGPPSPPDPPVVPEIPRPRPAEHSPLTDGGLLGGAVASDAFASYRSGSDSYQPESASYQDGSDFGSTAESPIEAAEPPIEAAEPPIEVVAEPSAEPPAASPEESPVDPSVADAPLEPGDTFGDDIAGAFSDDFAAGFTDLSDLDLPDLPSLTGLDLPAADAGLGSASDYLTPPGADLDLGRAHDGRRDDDVPPH